MHHVPGVLQQPGRHAEAHQEPCNAGLPPRLEHQQHLPVHLPHMSHCSSQTAALVGALGILSIIQRAAVMLFHLKVNIC